MTIITILMSIIIIYYNYHLINVQLVKLINHYKIFYYCTEKSIKELI